MSFEHYDNPPAPQDDKEVLRGLAAALLVVAEIAGKVGAQGRYLVTRYGHGYFLSR